MITAPSTSNSSGSASAAAVTYNHGYIWLISIVAALGGLLFGWDWVVVGGAKPFFERYFHIAHSRAGPTVAR